MLGQDEVPGSDASAKSLTRSGILTPASDTSLNLSDGVSSGSKKRKRDGNTMEDLLKDSFAVKPYPSAGFVKPRTLQPLILLPRADLPLSSLDLISPSNSLPQSRLFEARVKILELEERMGSQPMVLIARLDDGRTLYAVEREDRGLYVLCKLGSWLNLRQLRKAAVVSKQELPRALERKSPVQQESAPVALTAPDSSKYSKKKRLAIEAIQSLVKRPSTGLLTESQPVTMEPEPLGDAQPVREMVEQPLIDNPAPPTAAEIFENVRTQYLEALYLSKASLAYFAKGPLSRARAAFHLDFDSTLDLNDYIAFLESLVLSSSAIDKKFREGVPECVSLIDIQDHSADDAKGVSKPKKRKSNKRMKPGKNGLYPTEDALIRRWWSSHDDEAESGGPGTSKDETTKGRVTQLRIRETQLQMIVILEVLALQPLAKGLGDVSDGLPSGLPKNEEVEGKQKNPKHKKPDQLTVLIDVHIDRLCIWQSIQLESTKVLGAPGESQSATAGLGNLPGSVANGDNILRDFCIEVIGPFFASRLPDRCAAINRKLGGPVAISPPKPRLSKSSSFSGPSRPGAATKRPVPAKPRRSLQRVLTEDRERRSVSRGPERAISLMRSATMPVVPGLKRETSEAPSLSGIPFAESQPLAANRGGVLNSKRFSRREVDLGSLAPDMNAKAKKQAIIDAELKEAISGIKKPNRELAGKVLVETAEKRSASASHSRKSKKPIRNPLFQGVQISATPKANRSTNVFAQSRSPVFPGHDEEAGVNAVPSSSFSIVPQSVSRPSRENLYTKNPLFPSIQATPSRRTVSSSSNLKGGLLVGSSSEQPCFPPSSPLHIRRSSAKLFAVPDSVVKGLPTSWMSQGIQETPVKKRPDIKVPHSRPEPASGGNKENVEVETSTMTEDGSKINGTGQEVSIYTSLGWDDDIDELA